MKLKATVLIDKSFDDGKQFSKEWEQGDFEEFFKDEGEYLDRLADVLENNGKVYDEFTVTYTVTVKKESNDEQQG